MKNNYKRKEGFKAGQKGYSLLLGSFGMFYIPEGKPSNMVCRNARKGAVKIPEILDV